MYVDATTHTTSKVINNSTKKKYMNSLPTLTVLKEDTGELKKINSRLYVRIGCAELKQN